MPSYSARCALSSTLQLGELGEDQCMGVLHAFVRIVSYAIATAQSRRRHREAARRGAPFASALPEERMAEHRRVQSAIVHFMAKQQPIVGMARIVEGVSVLVDAGVPNQSHRTRLAMPVAAMRARRDASIARQRHTAVADRFKQPSRSEDARCRRQTGRVRRRGLRVAPQAVASRRGPYWRRRYQ